MSGTFRWSGTTILIFTPDSKLPLPYATQYDVSVDTTATAVSGRRLTEPYTFSFTTPTVRLLRTVAYRRGGQAAAPFVVLMRFNQPVQASDVAGHLTARFEPHKWIEPTLGPTLPSGQIDPADMSRFNAKGRGQPRGRLRSDPVALRLITTGTSAPGIEGLVAFETVTRVPSDSWMQLTLDDKLPSPAGRATPEPRRSTRSRRRPRSSSTGATARAPATLTAVIHWSSKSCGGCRAR
jgi:hypothetical protein